MGIFYNTPLLSSTLQAIGMCSRQQAAYLSGHLNTCFHFCFQADSLLQNAWDKCISIRLTFNVVVLGKKGRKSLTKKVSRLWSCSVTETPPHLWEFAAMAVMQTTSTHTTWWSLKPQKRRHNSGFSFIFTGVRQDSVGYPGCLEWIIQFVQEPSGTRWSLIYCSRVLQNVRDFLLSLISFMILPGSWRCGLQMLPYLLISLLTPRSFSRMQSLQHWMLCW